MNGGKEESIERERGWVGAGRKKGNTQSDG